MTENTPNIEPSGDQTRQDTIAALRAMTHKSAPSVITRTLRDGRPHRTTTEDGWIEMPAPRGGGVLDEAAAAQATEDILAELAASGLAVTLPLVLTGVEVDQLLPRVWDAWHGAGGDYDTEASLRAVIAELTVLIAYRLGHR